MENVESETVFKVPKLSLSTKPNTRQPVKCMDVKSTTSVVCDEDAVTTAVDITGNSDERVGEQAIRSNIVKKTFSRVPIPYEEPSWGGKPCDKYFLEVRVYITILSFCC